MLVQVDGLSFPRPIKRLFNVHCQPYLCFWVLDRLVKLIGKRSYNRSSIVLIGICALAKEVEYVFFLEPVIFGSVVVNQA